MHFRSWPRSEQKGGADDVHAEREHVVARLRRAVGLESVPRWAVAAHTSECGEKEGSCAEAAAFFVAETEFHFMSKHTRFLKKSVIPSRVSKLAFM